MHLCQGAPSHLLYTTLAFHSSVKPPNHTTSLSWNLWKKINTISMNNLGIRWQKLPLDVTRYFYVNSKITPANMSVQLTGNTCYFQVYL